MHYDNLIHNSTVQKYYEAIQKIVKEHPISAISVKMILEETNTSRQTFYNYFSDKFDLINYVYYYNVKMQTEMIFDSHEDFQSLIVLHIKHFYKNKDFYCKISKYKGQNNFCEFHKQLWIEKYTKQLTEYYDSRFDKLMQNSLNVYVSGLNIMIMHWLQNDCTPLSPNEVAQLCWRFNFPELNYMLSNPN